MGSETSFGKERYDDDKEDNFEDSLLINWINYLKIILKENSPILQIIEEVHTVQNAIKIQNAVDKLMKIGHTDNAYWLLKVIYGDDGTQLSQQKSQLKKS